MTRLGYFVFSLLLTMIIYIVVHFNGEKQTLSYTVMYFSVPLIATNFIMAVYSLFHWFLRQNEDVAREGITFLHATWILGAATYIAYKIIAVGGIMKLFSSLR